MSSSASENPSSENLGRVTFNTQTPYTEQFFYENIKNEISQWNTDHNTISQRETVYKRYEDWIYDVALPTVQANKAQSLPIIMNNFLKTKTRIETEFGNPGTENQLPERKKSERWVSDPILYFNVLTVLSLFGGLTDFFKPWLIEKTNWDPMLLFVIIGVLGIFVTGILRYKEFLPDFNKTIMHYLWASVATLIVGLAFYIPAFIIQQANASTGSKKDSVTLLGEISSTVAKIQKSLFDINEGQKDLGKKIEDLGKKVGVPKQEKSDDPQKELANLGVRWREEDFLNVLEQLRYKELELFFNAGWKIKPNYIVKFLYGTFDAKIANLFLRFKSSLSNGTCTSSYNKPDEFDDIFFRRLIASPERRHFFYSFCGPSQIRNFYNAQLNVIESEIEGYPTRRADVIRKRKECAESLSAKYWQQYQHRNRNFIITFVLDEVYYEAAGNSRLRNSNKLHLWNALSSPKLVDAPPDVMIKLAAAYGCQASLLLPKNPATERRNLYRSIVSEL